MPVFPFVTAMDHLVAVVQAYEDRVQEHLAKIDRWFVDIVISELDRRKSERAMVSFDDMLSNLASALTGGEGGDLARRLASATPAILIDEFQDTDPVQLTIFQRIEKSTQLQALFLIGDPKQAIYSFRGADVHAYLSMATRVPQAQQHTLNNNYRSDPLLIDALNIFFTQTSDPFVTPGIDYQPVGAPNPDKPGICHQAPVFSAPFQIRTPPEQPEDKSQSSKGIPQSDIPRYLARDIASVLAAGATIDGRPVSPDDIAVLTATNKDAVAINAALNQVGIPSVLANDGSVFQQKDAETFIHVMQAMLTPQNDRAIKTALATPEPALTKNASDKFRRTTKPGATWSPCFSTPQPCGTAMGSCAPLQKLTENSKSSVICSPSPRGPALPPTTATSWSV